MALPEARCQGSWLQRLFLHSQLRRISCLTDEKGEFYELVEEKSVKTLIDPKAVMHVIGTNMDLVDDNLRSEFIFINPNSKGQCGCGESFVTAGAAKQSGNG